MTDCATNCSHTTRHFSSTLGSLEQALSEGKKRSNYNTLCSFDAVIFLLHFERTWDPLLKSLFNCVSYLCRKGSEIDFKRIQIFSVGKYIF